MSKKGHRKGHEVSKETREKISNSLKGHFVSKETREKVSKALFGKPGANLGKKRTAEQRKRISLGHIGIKPNAHTIQRVIEAHKGKKQREDWVRKRVEARKRNGTYKLTEEHKALFCRKGKPCSEESKLKRSLKMRGENGPAWNGGTSKGDYNDGFPPFLKRKIKMRDNCLCQLCFVPTSWEKLHVHHIDYNKYNNEEWNLITLCNTCHSLTNHYREWFTHYFQKVMRPKLILRVA